MYNTKELALEVCKIGEEKVTKKNLTVLVSSMIAGLFIGLGYFGYIVLSSSTTDLLQAKFYGALIFSVGLVMILIAGGDLFTGNCLVTLGYFNKKYRFKSVLKNLSLVFIGNFIGALFLTALIYYSNYTKSTGNFIKELSETKVNLTFIEALFRGILCNILVSIGVYLSYASKTIAGKIIAAMLPVMLFVVSGYEHSVANMFVLTIGKAIGADITISQILINNLVPVTIGNFIGGSILIPGAYYIIFIKGKK